MKQVNRHIISSLSWNTTFDRKENAVQLQSRLSTWSNIRLQRVLSDVFDQMCPPGQTWKIGSLELDLGNIEYDQLEPELSLRVRKQLLEKLADMIRYPEKNGDTEFQILDEATSRLELIESFLLTGVIPWNGSLEQESADRLLTHQLKHNRPAAVEMLWYTGAKHDHVRRRMAWQFSDATVIKIIEALEPNNHETIVDFADQVTEIQRKEPIVPGSPADLRKHIWHWVLNYLYTDHGTVFNRIAFMKSTIRQMAAHFNIHYNELMKLIEDAVERINKESALLPDFVRTLDLLAAENRIAEQKETAASGPEIDYWQRLESFFLDANLRKADERHAEFNDLVVNLGRKDRPRLAALIRTIAREEAVLAAAVADLHEFALEITFSALLPGAAPALTERIVFLQMLGREMNVWRDDKLVWKAALKFAIEKPNAGSDQHVFIAYCVAEIAKAISRPAEEIFNRLLTARVPAAMKTVAALEIYSALVAAAVQEEGSSSYTSHAAQLRELIDALCGQMNTRTSGREAFLSVRAALIRKIRLHPKAALEALIAFPRKNELAAALPFFTDGTVTQLLIRNAKPEIQQVIAQVMRAVNALPATGAAAKIKALLHGHVEEWTLEAIITQAGADERRVLVFMLHELLIAETGSAYTAQFVLLCEELRVHGSAAMKNVIAEVQQQHSAAVRLPVAERVQMLVQMLVRRSEKTYEETARKEIAKLISENFTNATFAAWRKSGSKEGAEVLNVLVADGAQWMKKLVAEYKTLLRVLGDTGTGELEALLGEMYWQCALDYEVHRGNTTLLQKSFGIAVRYRFDLPEDGTASAAQQAAKKGRKKTKRGRTSEKSYILSSGAVLTQRELFKLIAECLESSRAEIESDGTHYELKELLELGLELKPAEIRKIIAAIPLTDSRLQVLKTASSFPQLSMWLMSDLKGETSSAMEVMRVLHDMIALIVPGAAADRFLDAFWTETWSVAAAGTWSREDLKKLIRTTFTKMAAELGVDAATFVQEMKSRNVRMTPLLRDNLIATFPAFSVLPENEHGTLAGRKLVAFESRGLLDSLVEHIVLHKRIPLWMGETDEAEMKMLLQEIVIHYPVKLLQVLKREVVSETQMRWLSTTISFRELVTSIGQLNSGNRSVLFMLEEFHAALGKTAITGISVQALQEVLFRKLVKAWISGNWKIVAVEHIWNELVWDVCLKHNLQKKNFLREMKKSAQLFSPAVKIALDTVMKSESEDEMKNIPPKKTPVKTKKTPAPGIPFKAPGPEGIAVRNAGVVLISSYVPMLFERLGLTAKGKFISPQAQNDAVHHLQYVITGLTKTEETFLPLNKVMCGLPLSYPVTDGITLTDAQKNLIEGLIKAAISHWPSIGDTSINGFRGNWLVRDGVLTEHDDKWQLVVEKRAYDLLLSKSPYSFSIIRYPWMDKSLHVTWPY